MISVMGLLGVRGGRLKSGLFQVRVVMPEMYIDVLLNFRDVAEERRDGEAEADRHRGAEAQRRGDEARVAREAHGAHVGGALQTCFAWF